jgi:hypothetical protein
MEHAVMSTGFTAIRPFRFVAALATAALVVTGLSLVPATSAHAASGNVTGTVFRDFNGNGRMDTGAAALTGVANDTGLAGVTVTAYDNLNAAVGSASSASNGTYSITVTGAATTALRIEFTGLPTGFTETAVYGTAAGTRTGSAVQFTTIGSTGLNFAAGVSSEYAQANAPLVTAIQYSGAPGFVASGSNTSSSGNPAIVAAPYNANFLKDTTNSSASETHSTGTTPVAPFADRKTLATFGQVGAVWGTVYRPSGNDIFASATYKRHAGLGSLGLGGIYRISNVLAADGTIATPSAANVTPWIDVSAAPLNINVGTAQTNAARGLTASNASAYDVDGFAKAGKIGIGGMALSADGSTLYFVNLFDKSLYAIDITNLSSPSVISITSLGLAANERPWALSIYKNQVYVGSVTTGETLSGGAAVANPGRSAAQTGMTATVRRTSFPLTAGSTFTPVLNQASLAYAKGDVYNNVLSGAGVNGQSHQWNSWTDTWNWSVNGGGSVGENTTGGWHIYPQPILSGLYFDESGYLTLGFSDRTSIQGGNRNFSAVTGTSAHYETGASGDLLIASPNAAQSSWTLENNGTSGARTTATNNTAQGPGGFEFYNDRMNVGDGGTHQEVTLGALAGIHGTREVISTAYDPNEGIRLSGTSWYNTVNGANLAGYEHTADAGGSGESTGSGTFQKGGGLGAVQLLAQAAPIEIGNRVWFDADQDGLQDADEPSLAGVTVQLLQGATVVATRVTGADGTYYFSSDSSSAFYAGAAFTPNGGDYTVKFIKPTLGNAPIDAATFGNVPWSSVSLTDNGSSSDLAGSDPDPTTGEYVYTAGDPGNVDHDIDAGYTASTSFTMSKIISAGGAAPAAGQTFTLNAAATDFRGNTLGLGASSSVTLAGGETSSAISVPVGTHVTVTESGTSAYRSAVVSPSGSTLVTGTSSPFVFTVTNELFQDGRFRISKLVTGSAAASVASSQSFTVEYTYPGLATPGTLTVAKNGTSSLSAPIPYGTTVTLSEITPTGAPADVQWDTPTWAQVAAQSNGTVVDNGDGTASITINDNATLNVVLTNPTTRLFGDFSVTKAIGADAAASVPSDFEFTIQYSIDGGTTWIDRTVTKASPTTTVTDLPAGTTVLVREVAPGTAAPDVQWGTPVFSGTGVTVTPTGGSFDIAADSTRVVTLTNPTTRLYGQFSITKSVTGGATDLLEAGTEFTLEYSYPGLATPTTVTLENGEIYTSPNIPLGTEVTITETTPTDGLPAGASWGTPRLIVGGTPQANGSTITIDDQTVLEVTLENPTAVTPAISIDKSDSLGNPADTMADGQAYAPGESREIEITLTNTGTEDLRDVTFTDETIAGATVTALSYELPDGTILPATLNAGVWTATWADTFTGVAYWERGAVVTGTATLAIALGDEPHVDRAAVEGTGRYSGTTLERDNDYNAFTGGIQVIKYDGQKTDPAIKDADDNWITPAKPLADEDQDANDTDHAVEYPVNTPRPVRWVVTNTGTTWLTNLTLTDTATDGPAIDSDWTADLSEFGGPADYSFVDDGPWDGLLPPGASFFAEGTLTLGTDDTHTDDVEVVATVVVPETDAGGIPTGDPSIVGGDPVTAVDDEGEPFTVDDNDPFNAWTGEGPRVDIEKGDGTGTTITNDADTMEEAEAYHPGEERTVVLTVTNTGDEDLERVTLTDETLSGATITAITWTFPDGTTATATDVAGILTAEWANTFDDTSVWEPGDIITGTATVIVRSDDQPHVDRAAVEAFGVGSGIRVDDEDDYNAVTGAVQVIKYDGETPDPIVKNDSGDWVTPSKSDLDAGEDADTDANAVVVKPNTKRTIRWVITNTGTTALTNLAVEDITLSGTPIAPDWTADLSPIGGPANYSFVNDGPWDGVFLPGQSFFSEGTYTLAPFAGHADNVEVIADIVVPEVDAAGVPTGDPMLDIDGSPVLLRDNAGVVRTVDGGDPFTARAASLAITGVDPMVALWAALALLLGGMALMVLAPKRRRKH